MIESILILAAFIIGLAIGAGLTYWLIAFHVMPEEMTLYPVQEDHGPTDGAPLTLVSDPAHAEAAIAHGFDNGHALAPMSDLEVRAREGDR